MRLDRKHGSDIYIMYNIYILIYLWRTAVLETGASRHHVGPIESPHPTPQTSHHYCIEGFKEETQLGPHYTEVILLQSRSK